MKAMFNGQPIFGPRGPAGPDGNPIGTIISYMGTKSPKDYLICDGAAYNIADYSKLAEFFKEQFGSVNYFGGDGETTFAVPDLRNLFLRGFHGEAEEHLSGEVGKRQDGTVHNGVYGNGSSTAIIVPNEGRAIKDADTEEYSQYKITRTTESRSTETLSSFTSRPVNMAVLYCIKATTAEPYEDIYSTEEQRIGTWIDGKPLYRKCFKYSLPIRGNISSPLTDEIVGIKLSEIDSLVIQSGPVATSFSDGGTLGSYGYSIDYNSAGWHIRSFDSGYDHEVYGVACIEYTKTTDEGVST